MNDMERYLLFNDSVITARGHHVHRLGFRSDMATTADLLLLDCITRGESEIGILSASLRDLGIERSVPEIEAELVAAAAIPESSLELVSLESCWNPAIIVCDFSVGSAVSDWSGSIERLRERHTVLRFGLSARLSSDHEHDISFERFCAMAGQRSYYQYLQWVRGFIKSRRDAILVLTGPQDQVLLGDMAESHDVISILDLGWPGAIPLKDVGVPHFKDIDPLDWISEVLFAVRFNAPTDLHLLSRSMGTSYAAMEAYCHFHAGCVLFTCSDHEQAIRQIGRLEGDSLPVYCPATAPPVKVERTSGSLLIAADHEGQVDELRPVLECCAYLLDAGEISAVSLLSHGTLSKLVVHEDKLGLTHEPNPVINFSDYESILVVPGMLRSLQPFYEAVFTNARVAALPSRDSMILRLTSGVEYLESLSVDALQSWLSRPLPRESDTLNSHWDEHRLDSRVLAFLNAAKVPSHRFKSSKGAIL